MLSIVLILSVIVVLLVITRVCCFGSCHCVCRHNSEEESSNAIPDVTETVGRRTDAENAPVASGVDHVSICTAQPPTYEEALHRPKSSSSHCTATRL